MSSIFRQFTGKKDGNYLVLIDGVLKRIYPVDDYTPGFALVAEHATEHHFLWMPLLGQYHKDPALKMPQWLCGKTSQAMIYNFYQLAKGGAPSDRYITHWTGEHSGWHLDPRFPNGDRAFSNIASIDPGALGKDGGTTGIGASTTGDSRITELPSNYLTIQPNDRTIQTLCHYDGHVLHPFAGVKANDKSGLSARAQAAADIASDPAKLERALARVLESLRRNHPVLFYSAITGSGDIHVITFAGYCRLREAGKEPSLWLLVADPSTQPPIDHRTSRGQRPTYLLDAQLLGRLDGLASNHSIITLVSGDWETAQGSLYLLRASTLFKEKPTHQMPHGLWLDYFPTDIADPTEKAGGRIGVGDRLPRTSVAEGGVFSSLDSWPYRAPLNPPNVQPNPWRLFANNESASNGVGGYYAIGLKRNIHGGIHLYPESASAPPSARTARPLRSILYPPENVPVTPAADLPRTTVRALGPGYVVAARLPGLGSPVLYSDPLAHLGQWPGFVLLRHELAEHAENGKRGIFYSLYMHLCPPALSVEKSRDGSPSVKLDPADPYLSQVPWFRNLWQRRFGAFVRVVDPPAKPAAAAPTFALGELLWSAQPVPEDFAKSRNSPARRATYSTFGRVPSLCPTGPDGTLEWLFKPSPAQLPEAAQAFAEGKVVTFSEPFFPVNAADPLGFVAPLPDSAIQAMFGFSYEALLMDEKGDETSVRRRAEFRSGALHFQVFAPVEDPGDGKVNGIELLASLAEQITQGGSSSSGNGNGAGAPASPKLITVEDDGDDNFLSLEELKGRFKDALPSEDASRFEKAFEGCEDILVHDKTHADFSYASKVIALLDSATSFSPPSDADWSAGCRYTYPVTVELALEHLLPPDKNPLAGGQYHIALAFEKGPPEAAIPLSCGEDCHKSECGKGKLGFHPPPAGDSAGGSVTPNPRACAPGALVLDAGAFNARTSAGVLKLSLRVPAEADRMKLSAGPGFFLASDKSPGQSELIFLSDALKERWRNVKLKQPNEWSQSGYDALAQKLEKYSLHLAPESRELAWIDSGKEVAIGRKELVGGLAGFVSKVKTGLLGFLGAVSDVVNLHPVTALWLLNALSLRDRASLTASPAAAAFGNKDPKPFCLSWAAPPEPALGDAVHALVLDDDLGYDNKRSVTLLAKQGDRTLVLADRAPYGAGGVIALPLTVTFWGQWTLTSNPEERHSDAVVGVKTLTVPALEFDDYSPRELASDLNAPKRLSDGAFLWMLKVKGRAPREVEGVVGVQVEQLGRWPADGVREPVLLPAFARSSGLSPADAKALEAIPAQRQYLRMDGEWILGADEVAAKKDRILPGAINIAPGLPLSAFLRAPSDVRIACSLMDAVQSLRGKVDRHLKIARIDPEGLELQLRPLGPIPIPQGAAASPGESPLLIAARHWLPRTVSVQQAEKVSAPSSVGEITLRIAPGALERLEACAALKPRAAALRTSPDGLFIVDATDGAATNDFPWSEIATAYRESGGAFRLSVELAKGLHYLANVAKLAPVAIAYLSSDGVTCLVATANNAKAAEAARSSGLFASVEPRGSQLKLVACLDPEHSLFVKVDPAPVLAALQQRDDIEPGKVLPFRFFFETANGIHYLPRKGGGSCPLHGDAVPSAAYNDYIPAAAPLRSRPSAVAGQFRKIALDGPRLTWATVGTGAILADVALLGEESQWAGCELAFYRYPASGAGGLTKGPAAKTRPANAVLASKVKVAPGQTTYSARIAVTDDAAFSGVVAVRVEANPPHASDAGPSLAEATIDCTPRFLSSEPLLDDSVTGELLVQAHLTCVPFAEGRSVSAKTTKFTVSVTEMTSRQEPPAIRYDPPAANDGKTGYVDAKGWARARIALGTGKPSPSPPHPGRPQATTPRVRSLQPGAYQICVTATARGKTFECKGKYILDPPCASCPSPQANYPYAPEAMDLVFRLASPIRAYSERYQVPPAALAGALADEYSANRGWDISARWADDDVIVANTPPPLQEADLAKSRAPVPGATLNKGSVSPRSAQQLYCQYSSQLEARYSDSKAACGGLDEYLRSSQGIVQRAAVVLREGQDILAHLMLGFPKCKREAILAEYYLKGPERQLGAASAREQLRPSEGCRICLQRSQLLAELSAFD